MRSFKYVGWCNRFNKGSNSIEDVGIGLGGIMDAPMRRSTFAPYHGASIGSFVVVVDGGGIPYMI